MKKNLKGLSPLFFISSIIISLILLPSILLIAKVFAGHGEYWEHIKEFLLRDYLINSLILVLSVGSITCIFGVFFSWILSHYDFKINRLLYAMLFIPLAIPPYIAGYVYGGIFGYTGTLERIMRHFNFNPIRIDMYSIGGAIFIYSLFLMPYIVLIMSSFYNKLPASYFDTSRLLGKNSMQTFFKIVLPMSRGAIMGGVVLVVLEVLNDYGLVKYFGIPTFSTAIFTTWFGLGDVSSAIRLAAILMIFVFMVLAIENLLRGDGRISQPRALAKSNIKKKPRKLLVVIFAFVYSLYVSFAVIIPIIQLGFWSVIASRDVVFRNLDKAFKNTITLAIIVTIAVIVCGIIIGNFGRLSKTLASKIYSRIVILGYSIPASIIAIAVLTFFLTADRNLFKLYELLHLKKLFLTSSVIMLIFALIIRFMAIGFNSIEAGYKKLGIRYYEASKLLGKNGISTFIKVDIPLLKPAIISAFILTFVDVLKELPLTLILRPFNYDTLSTLVFTYAGDEMIHEASIYALIIIGISSIALILLQWVQKEKKI